MASQLLGKRFYGLNTQTAATIITQLIEPWKNAFTRVVGLRYRCSTTSHTLTVMRPCNMVTFAADAAASQAAVVLSQDPGAYSTSAGGVTLESANNVIAASDFVVYETALGTYVLDTVASGTGTTPTLTTNLPTGGVKAGGKLWFYGIISDLNPNNHAVHPTYTIPVSTNSVWGRSDCIGSIPDHPLLNVGGGMYQPLILHSGNATAAGFIDSVGVEYWSRP